MHRFRPAPDVLALAVRETLAAAGTDGARLAFRRRPGAALLAILRNALLARLCVRLPFLRKVQERGSLPAAPNGRARQVHVVKRSLYKLVSLRRTQKLRRRFVVVRAVRRGYTVPDENAWREVSTSVDTFQTILRGWNVRSHEEAQSPAKIMLNVKYWNGRAGSVAAARGQEAVS